MANKWEKYIITGIWFFDFPHKHIAYVKLFELVNNELANGKKVSKDHVINLIKSGNAVVTAEWNYKNSNWSLGAKVGYYTHNGNNYLRTAPDDTTSNNLDHSLNMDWI